MSTFLSILHVISWIIFLGLIPLTLAALWIKNRSSVQCWIRLHQQQERWLLARCIPTDADEKAQNSTLQNIVEQARNYEWEASCVYRKRNKKTGEWTIGLISHKDPKTSDGTSEFTEIPPSKVLRASGTPRDEGVTILDKAKAWSEPKGIALPTNLYSLTAQSFQCWEWQLTDETHSANWLSRLAERIFEMRDIAFYPLIITPLTMAMLGTGNSWLFGIGIFAIILLSGSHKFVFLHQREDATQERHLQNY